jgi:hypothetical protein
MYELISVIFDGDMLMMLFVVSAVAIVINIRNYE